MRSDTRDDGPGSAEAPKPTVQVAPLGVDAKGRPRTPAKGLLGLRLVRIDAGRQMEEMKGVFRAAGNHTAQMDALATLRRWQLDPRLDSISRQRANALVWRFQSNGWDEV